MLRGKVRVRVRFGVRNTTRRTVTHSVSRPEALAIAAVRLAMEDALSVPEELSTSRDACALISRTTGGGGEDGGGTDGGSGEGGDCGLKIGGGGGGEGGSGGGGGDGGGEGGERGGGGGSGSPPVRTSMTGSASMAMPRAEVAASAEWRMSPSAAEVEEMVAPSSTKMVTVRRTLPASTVMLTASRRAPTTLANCCCRSEVFEKSPTLPAASSVTIILGGGGGGVAGGGGGV